MLIAVLPGVTMCIPCSGKIVKDKRMRDELATNGAKKFQTENDACNYND